MSIDSFSILALSSGVIENILFSEYVCNFSAAFIASYNFSFPSSQSSPKIETKYLILLYKIYYLFKATLF
jgi:hypothetical protein